MRIVNSVVFATAGFLAVAAHGVTIDYATVGNAGNPPNTNGWGSVSGTFQISKIEITNAQYVAFLNAVDPAGINPDNVYDSRMGSDANGGIAFSGAASQAKYSVKAGLSPNNSPYGQMPVIFTSWFSAARFVNWLQNGQQPDSGSMRQGTYSLGNATSGTIVPRSSGTGQQVVLPSRDEWYKAAYYNGSTYLPWPTNSNTTPTNTVVNATLPNAANYGGASTPTLGPLPVGWYVATTSPYGLYDMLGNVTEYTDTAGTGADAGGVQVLGGSWRTPLNGITAWSSTAPPVFRPPAPGADDLGFRVAVVQAVPEPAPTLTTVAGAVIAIGRAWRLRRGRRRVTAA